MRVWDWKNISIIGLSLLFVAARFHVSLLITIVTTFVQLLPLPSLADVLFSLLFSIMHYLLIFTTKYGCYAYSVLSIHQF